MGLGRDRWKPRRKRGPFLLAPSFRALHATLAFLFAPSVTTEQEHRSHRSCTSMQHSTSHSLPSQKSNWLLTFAIFP